MCDKELLVSYLYDDVDGAERQTFERHLESCGDCRDELQALRGTRKQLASWAPAEPALGFAIVGSESRPERARFQLNPAWGLAAAAILVLAVASAVANLNIRVDGNGLAIRTGWSSNAGERDAASANALQSGSVSRDDIAALQQRIRDLETAMAQRVAPAAAPVTASADAGTLGRMSEAEFVRRVNLLIAERAGRSEQELAMRMAAGMREMHAVHQDDMVRLQQTFNQSQGLLNDEVFRQRAQLNEFVRVVGSQSQR